MPRRLWKPQNADRLISATFGLWFVYEAILLFIVSISTAESAVTFFEPIWPWVFAAAGVAGLVYAVKPSLRLLAFTGGLMIAALLSRSFSLVAQWVAGTGPLGWARTFFGAGVWVMLGYSVGLIWTRLLRPLSLTRQRP